MSSANNSCALLPSKQHYARALSIQSACRLEVRPSIMNREQLNNEQKTSCVRHTSERRNYLNPKFAKSSVGGFCAAGGELRAASDIHGSSSSGESNGVLTAEEGTTEAAAPAPRPAAAAGGATTEPYALEKKSAAGPAAAGGGASANEPFGAGAGFAPAAAACLCAGNFCTASACSRSCSSNPGGLLTEAAWEGRCCGCCGEWKRGCWG